MMIDSIFRSESIAKNVVSDIIEKCNKILKKFEEDVIRIVKTYEKYLEALSIMRAYLAEDVVKEIEEKIKEEYKREIRNAIVRSSERIIEVLCEVEYIDAREVVEYLYKHINSQHR